LKNSILYGTSLLIIIALAALQGCGIYSMSGIATSAKTIQVDPFFNNTDLGPANLGVIFTNKLKEYYQQNSNLQVAGENGELQIEGVITGYTLTPVSPVSSGNVIQPDAAALTRLTITVRANYIDTIEPKNSFKDKSFSFYADFPNTQDLTAARESLERRIFDQIMLDIFNVTVANW
jgi:hypothetical protein